MNKCLRSTGAVVAAVCALLPGCKSNPTSSQCLLGQPVAIPPSDASLQTVVADLYLPDGRTVSLSASNLPPSVVSNRNGQVTVIAKAMDPEGVQDIQIWAAEKSCTTSGSIVTCAGPGLLGAPSASNPDAGAVGATGCTERAITQKLDVYKAASRDVSHEVTIVGTNFSGQKASLGIVLVQAQ